VGNVVVAIKLQSVLVNRVPEQEMATSSEWTQLWDSIPRFEQERRHDSLPKQPTSSSQIGPEPVPYDVEVKEPLEKPICRQATLASVEPKKSSHTVPHCPLM